MDADHTDTEKREVFEVEGLFEVSNVEGFPAEIGGELGDGLLGIGVAAEHHAGFDVVVRVGGGDGVCLRQSLPRGCIKDCVNGHRMVKPRRPDGNQPETA